MRLSRRATYALGLALAVVLAISAVTLWPAPLAQERTSSKSRSQERVKSPGTPVCPIPDSLRSAARRAVVNFRGVVPTRASDYFHRWRFDAQIGTFLQNKELRADMSSVLRWDRFAKNFPLSRPLVFRSAFGWEVRQRASANSEDG